MLYGDGGLTDECRMLMLSGRKRLKRVMDILGDSDDAELVTFTMTLVNKVCHSALSLRQTSSSSDASNRLHCRRTDRSIVFTRWRRCAHRRLVHGSLGPHRSNGISIGSAILQVLPMCAAQTDRQTDWLTDRQSRGTKDRVFSCRSEHSCIRNLDKLFTLQRATVTCWCMEGRAMQRTSLISVIRSILG